MTPHSPPTPDTQSHPHKRARQISPERESPNAAATAATTSALGATSPTTIETPIEGAGAPGSSKVGQSSNFRNVSACNRCRLRKNRCDQNLPSCASCEKAKVSCVGYDPITKKEIPRSYVYYLETRVGQLEALLRANNIQFPPAEDLEYCSRPGAEGTADPVPKDGSYQASPNISNRPGPQRLHHNGDEQARSNKVARHGAAPGGRSLGSTNGISFARVVYAAVQSTVTDHKSHSERGGVKPYTKSASGNGAAASGTSMRDSFFGLHTKPTINPAPFPDKELASHLVHIYFEHANPQIPVLHRVEFMQMFELAFAEEGRIRGPRELYMLNMVFAIGKGIFQTASSKNSDRPLMPKEAQPEEYHASAIVHLEACLSNSGGGLDELQAVLLLANFALLRPVPPGLWYIVGVAVRLAVDLGLYLEDGKELPSLPESDPTVDPQLQDAQIRQRGRREYVRDLRRRLWWSTYSLDRLVSTCVGRPFGVSDQVVTTEFPSLLEDRYITPSGFVARHMPSKEPTYKIVAYHYFRLRLLQSEVLQVLQFQQTQLARAGGQNRHNIYMHTQLPSPFLNRFDSFRSWRMDIDKRLYEWKNSAPSQEESGVDFSTEFFDLNYWQSVILLYRQSLEVPEMFEGEYNTSKEMNSPSLYPPETGGDEERVYMKVAEAGQKIIRIYRQLHVMGLVNFTYLATHHLFMAGISYLYAIWHSPLVRSRLSMDEVDFTILAATSVFTDLIEKCPPAEACRDAFERTAKATVKMAKQTGGFGQAPVRSNTGRGNHDYLTARDASGNRQRHHQQRLSMDQPGARTGRSQFDMGMADGYGTNHRTNQVPPIQTSAFPLGMSNIKSERDGFSMMRGLPGARTNTGGMSEEPDNSAIDPSLLPSASAGQSPISVTSMTPASANTNPGVNYLQSPTAMNTPGQLSYSGLQEMEFLQGLQGSTGMEGEVSGEGQLDLSGLGFGFEGMHHDFNDGQQVDLLDGFWFGGQQNGGAGGMP